MGRKSRAKADRKKFYEVARESGFAICLEQKQRYQDEWPDTWLTTDKSGIWTIGPASILGFDVNLHTPDGAMNCIYGWRIYPIGQQGPPHICIGACLPTRSAQLRPYREFVSGVIQDMIQKEALPTFDEIWQKLDPLARLDFHEPVIL